MYLYVFTTPSTILQDRAFPASFQAPSNLAETTVERMIDNKRDPDSMVGVAYLQTAGDIPFVLRTMVCEGGALASDS